MLQAVLFWRKFAKIYLRFYMLRYSAEECPDSPRYKAIGNSMAVPCMRWIGYKFNDYLVQSL